MARRILLIEDDAYIRELYEEVLKNAHYEVVTAIDGEEGLAKAQEGTYDLVLLDIMLPKLTGIEVLKQIKEEGSKLIDVPVYLLTNLGEETIAKETYKLGADGYLLKAKYLPRELIKEIDKYFVKTDSSTLKTINTSDA
jgi:two-component system alkaline phosphatase synthesis response regulator PhoP